MAFSATGSLMGYVYQCRYALLESLRRLRSQEDFIVSIETLDDVVFGTDGGPLELLQTKHHLKKAADLTAASPDLWKTIRIWCEGVADGSIPPDANLFLITTSIAAEGHAAYYLKPGGSRDVNRALERLNATAESSISQENRLSYTAFRKLTPDQKSNLFNSVVVIDGNPTITDLNHLLKEYFVFTVNHRYLDSYLQRLEGWWLHRVIKHLTEDDSPPILSEELYAEISSLREQFKIDNLPVDDDIMRASVEASGYQEKIFVHQLKLIEVGNPRILLAIKNYFRAFEQRSRWVREELLLVGELDRYEERLIEEWQTLFHQMIDDLGEEAAERSKKQAAQTLYKWVETGLHLPIRSGFTEPFLARGTYHMMADDMRIGWHPEFLERLGQLLNRGEQNN